MCENYEFFEIDKIKFFLILRKTVNKYFRILNEFNDEFRQKIKQKLDKKIEKQNVN